VEVDSFSGAAVAEVPIGVSTGRGGFGPSLALTYGSGAPNSEFGVGWALSGLLAITVSMRCHLPRYDGSDAYSFTGTGDLVPALVIQAGEWVADVRDEGAFWVRRHRARLEQGFLRVEQWTEKSTGRVHWRTRDVQDVLTVYGLAADGLSRIADPSDPARTWSWLPDAQYDPFGNVIAYDYVAEDLQSVDHTRACERGRASSAHRYLKSVRYANTKPIAFGSAEPAGNRWALSVVFDYGDHADTGGAPDPGPSVVWPVRPDPVSAYSAGFDVRRRRLCRRILQVHDFPDLDAQPVVVGAYALDHDKQPSGSTLTAVRYTGYRRDGGKLTSRSLPALSFSYSQPRPAAAFADAPPETAVGAPAGLGGSYRWVDLYGDGLPGILAQQGGSWYYKRNEGSGSFAAPEPVPAIPSWNLAESVLGDFDADGNTELAIMHGRDAGWFSYDREASSWGAFHALPSLPHQEAAGMVVQWIDLDGDGRSDLLVADPDRVVWYRNEGEHGFAGPFTQTRPSTDALPPPLTADPALDYFFADMTGDGLADQVLVRNGRVEYWPNLGQGRFGPAVLMDDTPNFAADWAFDARRVRLVDIDGTGGADVIYIGEGEIRYWRNAGGNAVVEGGVLTGLPHLDDLAAIDVLDFTGDGRPSLVWSSALAGAPSAIRYLPLTGAVTPRLLVGVDDGMGQSTTLSYSSSAAHELRDRAAGRPWATRLPAHHTVVDRLAIADAIGSTSLTQRYEYHDGAYDGRERAFAGFGHVDRYDADAGPASDGAVTACVRTWHHHGLAAGGPLLQVYTGDPLEPLVAAGRFEPAAAPENATEHMAGLRALRGHVVRRELYATDANGAILADPIEVLQEGVRIRRLQPAAGHHEASFFAYTAERITAVYESEAGDPRVAHELTLAVDDSGTPTREMTIAYARRNTATPDTPAQQSPVAIAREQDVTGVEAAGRHILGIPLEQREYEVGGFALASGAVLDRDQVATDLPAVLAAPLRFDQAFGGGLQARLIGRARALYWDDDQAAARPAGSFGAPLLLHHDESAVFTPQWATATFGPKLGAAEFTGAGYVLDDGLWWKSSEVNEYAAAAHFRLLTATVRRGGERTAFGYDADDLDVLTVIDTLGNVTAATYDHQARAVATLTDLNDNVTEIRYDALRVPVATATHGDVLDDGGTRQPLGEDPLSAYAPPAGATVESALADPGGHLQRATTAVFYGLDAFAMRGAPPSVVTLAREELVHDGKGGGTPGGRVMVVVEYLDGLGRTLQHKQLVEPGDAVERDANGTLVLDAEGVPRQAHADPRWLAGGNVVYDRKGQAVRSYEPFHSATAEYEGDAELARFGVFQQYSYDAAGRIVRADFPNGTFGRTEHTAWTCVGYDANDTVQDSDYRVVREGLPSADPEHLALTKAQAHAGTPTVVAYDPLRREVRQTTLIAPGEAHAAESTLDARGQELALTDQRGLTAYECRPDMLGRVLYVTSADAGETWTLIDADDRPVQLFNGRSVQITRTFDPLDRLVGVSVRGAGLDNLVQQVQYGEDGALADAKLRNLRGHPVVHYDEAGTSTVVRYDLQGRVLRHERRVRTAYDAEPDWAHPGAGEALDTAVHATVIDYDALGRPVTVTVPDGTTRSLKYLAGGGLQAVSMSSDDGKLTDLDVLAGAEYDARGERVTTSLGNGVTVTRTFDPQTFRVARLTTRRSTGRPAQRLLQDIAYTYDPVGNVVLCVDGAQTPANPGPFLQGLNVVPDCEYTYNALYRLVGATGRVHQTLLPNDYVPEAAGTIRGTRHLTLNNGAAVERYRRSYSYDDAGNLKRIRHVGVTRNWTTDVWVSATSNRGLPALDPGGNPVTNPDARFDAAGNPTSMPHLRALDYDYRSAPSRAVIIDRSSTGKPDNDERYVYDAQGQRVRVVAQRLVTGTTVEITDTLYLDGCEIKTIRRAGQVLLRRKTSHVSDGSGRLAIIHRWDVDTGARETNDTSAPRVRFQLPDHLGSAVLEVDDGAAVITYEEFFPYGGSSFLAGDNDREVAVKDYRFCGAQQDAATGFYYFGARYYVPWIGRWLTPDPAGPADDPNLYRYVHSNPVNLVDPTGLQTTTTPPQQRGHRQTVRGPRAPQAVIDSWNAMDNAQQANVLSQHYVWHKTASGVEWIPKAQALKKMESALAAGKDVSQFEVVKPHKPHKPHRDRSTVTHQGGTETITFEPPHIVVHPKVLSTDPEDAADPGADGAAPDSGSGTRGGRATNGGDGHGDHNSPGAQQGSDGGARGARGEPAGAGQGSDSADPESTGVHGAGGSSGTQTAPGAGPAGTGPGGGAGGTGTGSRGTGSGAGTAGIGPGDGGAGGPGRAGTGTAGDGPGGGPGTAGARSGAGGGVDDRGSLDGQPGGVAGGVEGGNGTPPGASDHGGTGTSPGSDTNLPSPNGLTAPTPGQGTGPGAGDGSQGTQRSGQGNGTGTGGDPGSASQPGGHGTSATGTPGGKGRESSGESGQSPPHQRTFGDRIIKYFGYLNFEFGGGGLSGESGGVPGGQGTHNWGGWGQALYAVLSVANTVLMFFGGAELKTAFAGLKAGLKTALTAALKVFTREFWGAAGSKIASLSARAAAAALPRRAWWRLVELFPKWSQSGWRTLRLARATETELALWDEVLHAEQVAVGRTAGGAGHLHAALRADGSTAVILDNWLADRGIQWTQRWQDVFNRALYDRASLLNQPISVMSGRAFTLGEVIAAEAGAASGGIFNIPFWPGP
jgi:RHS repeat-associated protein